MNNTPDTIKIDEVEYIRKDNKDNSEHTGEYKIVRTRSAGVFAGYITSQEGQSVHMVQARRIWYWEGAASLSQLSIDGTASPDKCKFPAPVEVTLFEVIEILEVTKKAKKSIDSVPIWKV